jgi:membrane-associated protease RseP (regulator of RpoE activity)
MKYVAQLVFVLTAVLATTPAARPAAQMSGQPFPFYGEEPWGGSYLGVDTQDVTSDRLGALHLKDERGVEVTMVDQDAPAGKAGLKEHDVILSINDQQVQSVEQLRRLIHEIPAGRTISIGISRDGQPMTLHAQLAERNKMPDMNFNFHGPNINVPVVRIPPINIPEIDVPNIVVVHAPRSSGMMIENLTPQLGEFFGVKGGQGVLVRSVEKGSRAEQAGIRAGDVIVKINGSAVNDCSDFSRLLRSRTSTKATVVVMRERREQTLTLNLPEKRTGSIRSEGCEDLGEAVCAQIKAGTAEVAAAIPVITADVRKMQPDLEKMKKQIEQEIRRQKPQMEKLQKEVQEQVRSHQGEIQQQMEQMRKELDKQKEELRKEMQEWRKSADI